MPTWLQIVLAVASALSPIALFLCGLMVNWVKGIQADHALLVREVATLRAHVAENYIRQPEMSKALEELAHVRASLESMVAMVHEIKGRLGAT